MAWTVYYSYGTISDCAYFENEDEAQHFLEMIENRIEEFGNDPDNEYESMVEIKEDKNE